MKRRYIKLYPEITAHPVFKNAAALQVFIYLLTHADWQTGECEATTGQIARDCGRNPKANIHISEILTTLEEFGSIEIVMRKPLKIRIQNWKKWQAFENSPHVPQDVTHVPQDVTHVPQDVTHVPQDVTHVPQDVTHVPLPYKDSARARDIYNTRNIYNKKIKDVVDVVEEKNENAKTATTATANPSLFKTNVRTEPSQYRYPETPAEVLQEAARQCIPMTPEQARDFLEHYRSFGWRIRDTIIPPNCWQWKIRKWMQIEKNPRYPNTPATNPNNQRAGFRIDGVEPPTEDFQ